MHNISVNQSGLLKLLKDLISINSVNPSLSKNGQGEYEISRYIGNYLKNIGLDVEYQDLDKNRSNVIGILKGHGKCKSLMLNGHSDTVGADKMEISPFEPKYENSKLYGRGAIDMKAGIAAQIMAVESLLASGITPAGDILMAYTADEEYCSIGMESLLEEYTADAAIISEPTGLDIIIAHKGFAWIKIEILGKAAHGSLPDVGVDAIVKAGKVLTEIEKLGEAYRTRPMHPLLGSASIHASLISGGIELSTYPDYCKIELEKRTMPGEDKQQVEQEIRTILNGIKSQDSDFDAKFEVFFYRPPFEIPEDTPIVQTLYTTYQKITGQKPEMSGVGGWLESALLADAGIPTVIFGPTGGGPHAAIEYADMDSVALTCEVIAETILDYWGIKD